MISAFAQLGIKQPHVNDSRSLACHVGRDTALRHNTIPRYVTNLPGKEWSVKCHECVLAS